MGIYGILFALLMSSVAFLLVLPFGRERAVKAFGLATNAVGFLPILIAGLFLTSIWYVLLPTLIACKAFNWCAPFDAIRHFLGSS